MRVVTLLLAAPSLSVQSLKSSSWLSGSAIQEPALTLLICPTSLNASTVPIIRVQEQQVSQRYHYLLLLCCIFRQGIYRFRMYNRIKIDRPAHTKCLGNQYLRSVLVPEGIAQFFRSGYAEIVGNTSNFTIPFALTRRATQLLHNCTSHQGGYCCS